MNTAKHLFPLLVATVCAINNGEKPNITLYGTRVRAGSLNIVHLNCKTTIGTNGCWMEFHKNDKTEDTIRLENENCHHQSGTCVFNICDCSKDCKTFKLNITSSSRILNTTYGCETRIAFQNVVYSLRTAIKPVGEDFEVYETVITKGKPVEADPEIKIPKKLSIGVLVGIIIGTVIPVFFAASCICLYKRRTSELYSVRFRRRT